MSGARLRHLVRLRVEKSDEVRPLLTLDQIESGTGRVSGMTPDGEPEGQNKFEPGDVLFSKLRPYLAKSLLVQESSHGTGELLAMVPGDRLDARFLLYTTLSKPWLDLADLTSYGTKMPRTSWEAMADYRFPDLPLEVQRRIADFLDDQTARIDHIITARQAQSDFLTESLESFAAAAVTGRLHRGARVPSQIPWAPDLPEQWGSPRLTYVARMGTGHTPSRSEPAYWADCDIPWLTTSDVHRFRQDQIDTVNETAVQISKLGLQNSAAVLHPAGTVALSRTASAGFSIIMGRDMATSQDFATWTCGPDLDSGFLLWCLRAMRRDLMGRLAMGSTHKTIYFPDLLSIRIPLPNIREQRAVGAAIQQQADAVRAGRIGIQDSLHLLQDLKRSLISAAVSGEFDVSSADGSRVVA